MFSYWVENFRQIRKIIYVSCYDRFDIHILDIGPPVRFYHKCYTPEVAQTGTDPGCVLGVRFAIYLVGV